MAGLASFKRKLALIKKNKNAIPKSTEMFKVDSGWELLMTSSILKPYLNGWHHFYKGIMLNKGNEFECEIFACRDLVLSWIFSSRSDLSPEAQFASYLIDLFSDVASLRDSTHPSEVTMYEALKKSISTCLDSFNVDDKIKSKILGYSITQAKVGIQSADQLTEMLTQMKNKQLVAAMTNDDLDKCVLILSLIQFVSNGRLEFEYATCMFLLSVAKTGSVSRRHLDKKITGFRTSFNFASNYGVMINEGSLKTVWGAIQDELKSNRLTVPILVKNLYEIVTLMDNVLVTPLADQIAYRNQTSIMLICNSISSLPNFPWSALSVKNTAIEKELMELNEYLDLIQGDKYIGLILSGCSKDFPHLSYLSYQLSMKALGQETLSNFKGMGSTGQGVPKIYYDNLVRDYLADLANTLGSYKELSTMAIKTSIITKTGKLISSFLGGTKRNDDDDDDNDYPDGSSGQPPLQDPPVSDDEEDQDTSVEEPPKKSPRVADDSSPGPSAPPAETHDRVTLITKSPPARLSITIVENSFDVESDAKASVYVTKLPPMTRNKLSMMKVTPTSIQEAFYSAFRQSKDVYRISLTLMELSGIAVLPLAMRFSGRHYAIKIVRAGLFWHTLYRFKNDSAPTKMAVEFICHEFPSTGLLERFNSSDPTLPDIIQQLEFYCLSPGSTLHQIPMGLPLTPPSMETD